MEAARAPHAGGIPAGARGGAHQSSDGPQEASTAPSGGSFFTPYHRVASRGRLDSRASAANTARMRSPPPLAAPCRPCGAEPGPAPRWRLGDQKRPPHPPGQPHGARRLAMAVVGCTMRARGVPRGARLVGPLPPCPPSPHAVQDVARVHPRLVGEGCYHHSPP